MNQTKDPLVGKTLGGYRLDTLLSRGLSGRIYRARQISVERNVALKLLSPKLASDAAFVTRFLEETRAAAKLNHPNVLQIHDVVRSEKVTFYSMEYLPGGSLLDWVRRQGPVPWRTLATQLRDVAGALSYAEKKGIAHGYLSPSNLLFTQDSRLKVLNLGLGGRHARANGDGKRKPPPGVLPFMAPESIVDGKGDHRSDIYALGCTFFFGFSGRPPFQGKTAKEIFSQKMLRDPPELADTVEDLPDWLSDLVHQMVVRDPDQRPQSFEEIVGLLEKHLGRRGKSKGKKKSARARSGAASRSRGGRSRSSSRESRPGFLETPQGMVAVGAAAIVLIIVLVAAFSGGGDSSGDPTSGRNERVARGPSSGETRTGEGTGSRASRTDGGTSKRTGDGGATGKEAGAASAPSAAERQPGESLAEYRKRRQAELAAQVEATGENSRGVLLLMSRALEWEQNPPTLAEAVAVVTDLKQKYPDPAVAKAADEILKTVADRARQREIQEAVDQELAPELASKNYALAVEKLDALARKYPESQDIGEERSRVEAAAEEEFRSVAEEASGLSRAGEFDRAIELLDELQGRLPPKLRPRAEEALATLVESRDSAGELASKFAEAESRLSELIARLDFAAAKEVLASLPESSHPLHTERRERIIAEVTKTEEAWKALSGGLEKAQGARLTVGVDPYLAAQETFPGVIERHEKTDDGKVNVTVGKARSKDIDCGLFDLHDATLFEIIQKGGGEATPSLVEGLGLLLFHHEGAKRAWSVLVRHPAMPGAEKDLYAVRLRDAGQDALSREMESLEAEVGAGGFEAGSSPAAAKVEKLVERLENAVARHRGLPYYDGFRGRLATLYDTVQRAKLRADGVKGFFRGEAELLRSGKVRVVYDFSSEEQAEDFHSKEGSAKVDRKALVVRGEVRLLEGNPFKSSIDLTAKIASYEKATPNVNIALWTHDEDTVTYRSIRSTTGTTTRSLSSSSSTPPGSNDYLGFGVGYAPDNSYYSSYGAIRMIDSGLRVALPAFVIIGGKRGVPLPYSYSYYSTSNSGNCFWAESSYRDIKGQPLTVTLIHSPSGFQWSCNRIILSGKALNTAPGVKDWLAKEDATGSISIFTYGHRIVVASLEIEAELNPWWVEEEIERQAKGAFDAMESRYSTV